MDPNATLWLMRDAVKRIRSLMEKPPEPRYMSALSELEWRAGELASYAEALDEWICNGGFLPADWKDLLRGED